MWSRSVIRGLCYSASMEYGAARNTRNDPEAIRLWFSEHEGTMVH